MSNNGAKRSPDQQARKKEKDEADIFHDRMLYMLSKSTNIELLRCFVIEYKPGKNKITFDLHK